MRRKYVTLLFVGVGVAVIAAIGVGVYYLRTGEKENTILSTDGAGYAEEEIPHADSLMVGKWQSVSNPKWYKVYYDDYDEDAKMFWGKEWDENEDVYEEDLLYHGNGWFRWVKKGDILREFATMDARDVPIHHAYKIQQIKKDSILYRDIDYPKNIFPFTKVP